MNAIRNAWLRVPPGARSAITTILKALITVGAFYLLLAHKVTTEDGRHVTTFQAIREHIAEIDTSTFWMFCALAALTKFVGILASMYRWTLLLRGQGIVFPFRHIFGSFLIGRFIGTFLPSTLGLDGYKLYDAARFSGRTVEATAATVIEKVLGVLGIFLTFLITLPFGIAIFGARGFEVALFTVPIAAGVIGSFFLVLFKPGLVQWLIENLPVPGKAKIRGFVTRVSTASAAYSGHKLVLVNAAAQSFVVHFTTAAMYYFTALAVSAVGAGFWEVTLASTIQIFATVISPFTIAGEGVREIVQALLLAEHIGASASIMSAALGFWAAEGLTLGGAYFWWVRKSDYRPDFVIVDGREISPPSASADEIAHARSAVVARVDSLS